MILAQNATGFYWVLLVRLVARCTTKETDYKITMYPGQTLQRRPLAMQVFLVPLQTNMNLRIPQYTTPIALM